ncbi:MULTISPECIES: phage/plasmid primase, P4 family [unclassified Oceanispirochaeta]|uniref:DNA primase family protein n=1 Tax=unclassified Oceanispirochaeta TaxID=2635722 RepID=UPI000E09B4BC|nr:MULTISPECIES: phage/plasmid primase, P4 family [unclassified Oceanispirochaeta]MBF9018284.1 hypothetical protein [Oceanispirochaeta sp. M2]NPD74749.1 hypothetical protein [Oceanispirochaeta sp. M1]RDG29418.1 hypothetical protein DV872_21840 [Oceanispirochaeta sp. M1]
MSISNCKATTSSDPRIRIAPDALDQDQFLFNCANGVIDLKSGRLSPHDRERMITKYSPVPYNEEALCPHWKQFLKDIFDNNKELIKFIQRFLGCSLTVDMSCQSMFILYGRLAESVIKRLTGNDMISARFLYGEYFQFIPTFKIVMSTNHKPRIGGMDHAIWRRIKLIPFLQTFSEEKQDKKLTGKLEKEMPGILSWMVEGCLRWQREGLGGAVAISDATDEYKTEMSDVQMFLAEKCERDELQMIQSSVLYKEYTAWCEENHERPRSNRNFSIMLKESGMDKVRQSVGIFWLGIKIRKEKGC